MSSVTDVNIDNHFHDQITVTSLNEECSQLRSRLHCIRDFSKYFRLVANGSTQSDFTDPVTELWDLFSLGIPLCYIFDLLPREEGYSKIDYSPFTDSQDETNPISDRIRLHAIALFAMRIRTDNLAQKIPGCVLFTVTDLWARETTDVFVKVIQTVKAIVNHLPPSAFDSIPPVDSELHPITADGH